MSSDPMDLAVPGPSRAVPVLWMREPLLHFLVAGAALFGLDRWLHPPVTDNRTIVVTRQMRDSIIENYDEDHARKPTDRELKAVIDNWVADEILYREGRLLGLDTGDPTIRDRVVYKLKVMLTDEAKAREPDAPELEAWFTQNHARYDEPDRITFIATAPVDEATARREFEDVRHERESKELQQQARAFLDRPVGAVATVFGAPFAAAASEAKIGQWQVVQSTAGWHLVRVDARKPGHRAALADVREDALKVWREEQTVKATTLAMQRLKARYSVRMDP